MLLIRIIRQQKECFLERLKWVQKDWWKSHSVCLEGQFGKRVKIMLSSNVRAIIKHCLYLKLHFITSTDRHKVSRSDSEFKPQLSLPLASLVHFAAGLQNGHPLAWAKTGHRNQSSSLLLWVIPWLSLSSSADVHFWKTKLCFYLLSLKDILWLSNKNSLKYYGIIRK